MGKGIHGNFRNTIGRSEKHSLTDNLPNVERTYPLTPAGLFGEPSKKKNSDARIIESSAPVQTAYDFFNRLTDGYDKIVAIPYKSEEKKGCVAFMKDGSRVSIRKVSSSDGSPAVQITVTSPGRVKSHKIHFVKKGDNQ